MQKPARREFLQQLSLAAAAATVGCAAAPEDGLDFEAEQTRGLPDSAFDPEIILPFYEDDPIRLPRGRRRRVLIVGGGLAGLSAGLELAERGYEITLREAADVLGGRLSTRTERLRTGTFRVEHGLHMWFHQYYNSFDVLQRLGVSEKFQAFEQVYFQFRNYLPETLESRGAYPFNLLDIIKRSPNLSLSNAIGTFGAVKDIIFYDHASNVRNFDAETYQAWGRRTRVDKAFWDVIMAPAASVTLNDVSKISAAEMLQLMHIYFIGHPRAFNRVVTTEDHGTVVIDPWAEKIRALGGKIFVNAPVRGLRFAGDRVVGESGATETFDHVIVATDIPGLKRVMAGSTADDARGAALLERTRRETAALKIAPPYSVLRVWFDKPTAPRPYSQAVIETSEYRPINLVALFHMLEKESIDWAKRTNGSILEYHLYSTPELAGLDAEQIWRAIAPVAMEITPDLRGAKPLDFSLGAYENFTSYEVGQGRVRPRPNSPKLDWGVRNLALAGDWVQTLYPSALMERAVSTGREAANHVLRTDRVREVALRVPKLKGPGIVPRF
jgi:isorenieratene synthase